MSRIEMQPGKTEIPMFGKSLIAALFIASMVIPLEGMSETRQAVASGNKAPVLALSPKLRAALVAEMAGIKEELAVLAPAIAMGDWDVATKRAERIRDSYIMKQKLSRADLEELERALPPDFAEMDARFHRHAEGLAHAAATQNHELSVFYLSRMLEGCGSCHARYATHVLKGFKQPEPAGHGH